MILNEVLPLPTAPLMSDPLGMQAMRADDETEAQIAARKELAKAEAEIAAEHLAQQSAITQSVNQQIEANKASQSVPILGDMQAMTAPEVKPINGPVIPLDVPGAFELRGYLDAEGNATPEGELFLELQDSGIFDERGYLTPKGAAFTMAKEDAEKPENLSAYIMRDKAGLHDEAEIDMSDALTGVGGYLMDAVKGATKGYIDMALGPLSPYSEAERNLAQNAALMGGVKSSAALGAGLDRVAAKLWLEPDEDEGAYYASKQAFAREKRAIQDMQAAEFVGGVLGSAEVLTEMDAAREARIAELGPEKAAEIERQAEAFGGLVLDPSNAASFGSGFFASKLAQGPTLFARLSQTVEKATVAKAIASGAEAAALAAKTTADKTGKVAALAMKRAEDLASIGDNAGSAMALTTAERFGARSAAMTDEVAKLTQTAAEKAALAEKLAAKAGGAQAVLSTIEAAKQARQIPLQAVGAATERVGELLIKAEDGLKRVAEEIGVSRQMFDVVKGSATMLGLNVPGFGLGNIAALFAAAPVLKGVGNFTRLVGKETLAARGSLPFWRRVANNSTATPLARNTAHLIDELTLGGKVLTPARTASNVARGAGAAAPVDIGFEVLAEGGDVNPNVIKRAVAESIVFGGSGAAFGSIVSGSIGQKQRQMMGDEINFRNGLVDSQAALFRQMGQGARRNMATYAAQFPSLNFELSDSGPSSYDRTTNTAKINVRQSDWLKPLVAHEVNHYLQVRSQMEPGITALLVGGEGVGGMFRSADGTLAPDFKAAMDNYNRRVAADGGKSLTPEEFAIEYFNEATVDDLVGMVESGELAKMGGRTNTERFIRRIAGQMVQKTPIIRDIFIKLGGAYDAQGRMVQGNGLLAGGVREIPGAKKMLAEMVGKQAGRRDFKIESTSKDGKGEKGIVLPESMVKGNRPMASTLHSQFKFNEKGEVVMDAEGNPVPIDRGEELRRQAAGLIVLEEMAEKIERGDLMPEGALAKDDAGDFVGTHLDPDAIKRLEQSGVFNVHQLRTLRMLNESSRKQKGETFMMVYQPAIARDRKGKVKYASLAPTFREVVPVGVKITKAGNIIVETMSVTQLMENIRERAGTKRGKRLYNGDQIEMLRDVEASLDLHRKGQRTDAYFAEKYGEGRGPEFKNFVNTLFGLMTPDQQNMNPLFMEDTVKSSTNVFKSRRVDRINQTARLQGRPALPFGYEQVKGNWFPQGDPTPIQTNE